MSGYVDASAVSDWANEAMLWAIAAGLLDADAEGNLRPNDPATRAEFMRLVNG